MTARRVRRGAASLLVALVALATLVLTPTAPAAASAADRGDGPLAATAHLTFDVTTGEVLAAHDARTPHLVASTFKIVTALVVRANVDLTAEVPVSRRATEVPALKLSLKAGERWNANALLHAMLIASLNDAAYALAEAAGGGTIAGFEEALAAHGRRLGFADAPVLVDPAGLDDEFSNKGGNRISARDLAIATRAFLADPLLAGIATMPRYAFDGGDGEPHSVVNHNLMLANYPGAIGIKTGYTERSGRSLVAAATRGDRTYAVIVIDGVDPVALATAQLDAAFAGTLPGTDDTLPPVAIAQTALDGRPAATSRPETFSAQVPLAGTVPLQTAGTLVAATIAAVAVAGTVTRRGRRRPDRVDPRT